MTLALWIVLIFAGLLGLHGLALWMERRGWIYYAKRRASGGALASAILELQQFAQPGTKHILEMKRESRAEQDNESDPK